MGGMVCRHLSSEGRGHQLWRVGKPWEPQFAEHFPTCSFPASYALTSPEPAGQASSLADLGRAAEAAVSRAQSKQGPSLSLLCQGGRHRL